MAVAVGAFRSTNSDIGPMNLSDNAPLSLPAEYSPGATIIDQLQAQPTLGFPWVVTGWSIVFQLALQKIGGQISGRLGHLYGGLVRDARQTGFPSEPWVSPVLALPPDLSTLAELWDGSQDPAPPTWLTSNPSIPLNEILMSNELPQPLVLQAGERLGMGMWMTPSLVEANLQVVAARWTINYDASRQSR